MRIRGLKSASMALITGSVCLSAGCRLWRSETVDRGPLPEANLHVGPTSSLPPVVHGGPYSPVRPFIPDNSHPPIRKDTAIAAVTAPGTAPQPIKLPPDLPEPPTGPASSSTVRNDGPSLAPILPPPDVSELLKVAPQPIGSSTATGIPAKPALVIPAPTALDVPKAPLHPRVGDIFVSAPIKATAPVTADIIRSPLAADTKDAPRPFPLKPGETFGRADDFRWVAGVLDRHHKGGYWTIRYADFSNDDRWGGKVRITDEGQLRGFKDGDVIYVEGELLAPVTGSASESATAFPPYRISDVRLVRKAK